MGGQNFNFAPQFPQNGGFPVPNFLFLEENFSDTLQFGGDAPRPPPQRRH